MKFTTTIASLILGFLVSTSIAKPIPQDLDSPVNIKKDYIVMLADNEKRPIMTVAAEMGYEASEINNVFENENVRGFSVKMDVNRPQLMDARENVKYTEEDIQLKPLVMPYDKREAEVQDATFTHGFTKFSKRQEALVFLQQQSAPWNLQRMSSNEAVSVGNGVRATDVAFQYRFASTSGDGVDVYLMDTGINANHVDFEGRAKFLASFDQGATEFEDTEGHGTHTAGTVGSKTFGMAKNCNLFMVKVFPSSGGGSTAFTSMGIDMVTKRHLERQSEANFAGSVINMSLGGPGRSRMLTAALKRATDAGVHVAVSAGNEGQDACGTTPAGLSQQLPIISVGASDIRDRKASFSNFGPCTDIYAPGTQIKSTFIPSTNSVGVLQGTSMSSPAVAGLIAYNLALNPSLKNDPAGMKRKILADAVNAGSGIVDVDAQGNKLVKGIANNGFTASTI